MNTKNLLKGFKRPKEVLKSSTQNDKYHGEYVIEPLERGFGITVGNALRRTLLSSLPGYAIVAVKFDNVLHEFSTIKGVVEDVAEIIINLKKVVVSLHNDVEGKTIELDKKGPGAVTARDLMVDNDIHIFNPDQHLATLAADGHLKMRIQIDLGRGYVAAEDMKDRIDETDVIPVDAIFTPVKKVSFKVQDLRIGNRSDYNKVVFCVLTNGVLTAEEAVGSAAKILKEMFSPLIHFKDVDEKIEEYSIEDGKSRTESKSEKVLKMPVEDLELSVRSLHCLQTADIHLVGDLIKRNDEELIKTKNFGKKSLQEIREKLEKMNLNFGMSEVDIKQYIENN